MLGSWNREHTLGRHPCQRDLRQGRVAPVGNRQAGCEEGPVGLQRVLAEARHMPAEVVFGEGFAVDRAGEQAAAKSQEKRVRVRGCYSDS